MTRPNLLKERFANNTTTLGTHVYLPDPAVVEAIGHTGMFDYVEFLAEYNAFTLHDLDTFARAAELMNLGSLIKLDWELNRYFAQRAVGSGFDGVLFADPRTPEDVDYAIASVRPDNPDFSGSYGASARRRARPGYGGSPGDIASVANTAVGVMVEVPALLERLEEVLTRPDIDFIQWGPADFALRSGLDGAADAAKIQASEKELIAMCDAAGVPYRIELHSLADLRRYADQGARHFSIGYDLGVLHDGFTELGDGARRMLEEYS